jgi:hypothetical protein
VNLVQTCTGAFWADLVVIVGDGADGHWNLLQKLIPDAPGRKVTRILDWYHAASHLYKAALAVRGSKTATQRGEAVKWLKPLLAALHDGHPSVVLQRLRKLTGLSQRPQQEVDRCIDYIDKRKDRMHYARYRKNNMLIGSGPIESVHAWVFQARIRLPGMRWSLRGVNAILRLRCAWASGTWDKDIDRVLNAKLHAQYYDTEAAM